MIEAFELDRITFGCGNFGGMGSSPALRDKGDDQTQALALLDYARDLGLVRFDTANTYGGGASEIILGAWLRRQSKAFRAGVHVATKVGNPHGCPVGDQPLSRTQIAEHLDRSLERLGLEQISLYYIHEFEPQTPLDETLEAFDRALSSGKIAAFGVSNAALGHLKSVLAQAPSALRGAFSHVQNEFNLLHQDDLSEVIPFCRTHGLSYVAFSPLAGGLLTGKYQQGRAPAAGTRVNSAPDYYSHRWTKDTFETIGDLTRTAALTGSSIPGAALRFILDTPGIDGLIVAPRTTGQFLGYDIMRGSA